MIAAEAAEIKKWATVGHEKAAQISKVKVPTAALKPNPTFPPLKCKRLRNGLSISAPTPLAFPRNTSEATSLAFMESVPIDHPNPPQAAHPYTNGS